MSHSMPVAEQEASAQSNGTRIFTGNLFRVRQGNGWVGLVAGRALVRHRGQETIRRNVPSESGSWPSMGSRSRTLS